MAGGCGVRVGVVVLPVGVGRRMKNSEELGLFHFPTLIAIKVVVCTTGQGLFSGLVEVTAT
jgi:hypothetical protein